MATPVEGIVNLRRVSYPFTCRDPLKSTRWPGLKFPAAFFNPTPASGDDPTAGGEPKVSHKRRSSWVPIGHTAAC